MESLDDSVEDPNYEASEGEKEDSSEYGSEYESEYESELIVNSKKTKKMKPGTSTPVNPMKKSQFNKKLPQVVARKTVSNIIKDIYCFGDQENTTDQNVDFNINKGI